MRIGKWAGIVAGLAAITLAATATPAGAVVGGTQTNVQRYPWMVILSDKSGNSDSSGQFCGGSLVTPTKVVTAAHCVNRRTPAEFQVIAGRTDLRTDAGTTVGVASVWQAPRVPPPTPKPGDLPYLGGGDLAVVTLDKALPYRTVPLIRADQTYLYRPGTPAAVLGWGVYQEKDLPGPSPILKRGEFRMLGYNTCNEAATHHPALPTQLDPRFFVCGGNSANAGPLAGSVCGGDSGGPLLVAGRLAGVVSPILSRNGKVCEGAYSGFTRLDAYAADIRAQL
jgi:secreted trypsin-like serine protease